MGLSNAMAENFSKVEFIKSAPSVDLAPGEKKKEVILLGRSNVGKSSLLNALTNQKIAFSSKKAGKTLYLNYFLIDKRFYLVDSPGYGYTAYGSKLDTSFSEMMEGYFRSDRKGIALLLVDSRRGAGEEEHSLIELAKKEDMPIVVVYTKADTLGQKEKALREKEAALLRNNGVECLYSYKDKRSVNELRGLISRLLTTI